MELIDPSYTRVSQILSIFQGYAHVPAAKLKKAQEVGTSIHAAIEAYFKENFEPVIYAHMPYFESFLKWADVIYPNPLLLEERLYDHSLKVTGRIDLLAKIGEIPYLIDFKTGSWAHYDIWELQLTFYRMLLKAFQYFILPDKFMIVHLQKDGSVPIVYEYTHDPKNDKVCLAALRCYRFFNKDLT